MKITIDSSVVTRFPDVKVGYLIGNGLNNTASSESITQLLRTAEEQLRNRYKLEELSALPKIADWREAYRAFGFKPSEYRCSVEALVRRVLQGKSLPSINPIVDLYNLVSIKHLLPAGGDDLDKVTGNITLTVADGSELFVMLGHTEPEKIKTGEVVYRDEKEVLCRAWNYRECDKTKITEQTQNVGLMLEGLQHTSHEEITNALTELEKLLSAHCGGTFRTGIVDKNHSTASF